MKTDKEIINDLKAYFYDEDGFGILNGSPRDIFADISSILGNPQTPQWALDEWPDLKKND